MILKETVIVIGGATSSGKSSLALDLARNIGGAIINADSQQVYGELPILTSSPVEQSKKKIPHFLYGDNQDFIGISSVYLWRLKAIQLIKFCHIHGIKPIVVGGTGLYLQVLIYGFCPIPNISLKLRLKVLELYKKSQLIDLYLLLKRINPYLLNIVHIIDIHRIIRIFEILNYTGMEIYKWKINIVPEYNLWDFYFIIINPKRELLLKHSYYRLRSMFDHGSIEEVLNFLKKDFPTTHPLFNVVGVKEHLSYFLGSDLDVTFNYTNIRTRQYIKRQVTWLKPYLKDTKVLNDLYPCINYINIINIIEKDLIFIQHSNIKLDVI